MISEFSAIPIYAIIGYIPNQCPIDKSIDQRNSNQPNFANSIVISTRSLSLDFTWFFSLSPISWWFRDIETQAIGLETA